MAKLVITDIPRMKAFFQKFASDSGELVVVSEIHRGIEELDRLEPELVVIQNHLSGISADIILKHFKSRTGDRPVRYALINTSAYLPPEVDASYELIIDPSLSDPDIQRTLEYLLMGRGEKPETGVARPQTQLQPITPLPDKPFTPDSQSTYGMPRRPNARIISAFSQQLDTNSSEMPQPLPASHGAPVIEYYRERELAIRDLHNKEHLLVDSEIVVPFYRKPAFLFVAVTIISVTAFTFFQHRPNPSRQIQPVDLAATPEKSRNASISGSPGLSAPVVTQTQDKPSPSELPPQPDQLVSHGAGRLRKPPSFLPLAGRDPSYTKDHPGWDSYRGTANEYRVFKDMDGTIKALQIIDRSGNGIQDSFYTSALKEVAGATSMRTTSSEIKDGYEVRRGDVAGLQLVQYRDAQGGRMRGFVITWP